MDEMIGHIWRIRVTNIIIDLDCGGLLLTTHQEEQIDQRIHGILVLTLTNHIEKRIWIIILNTYIVGIQVLM
jgi:hypothetical protein